MSKDLLRERDARVIQYALKSPFVRDPDLTRRAAREYPPISFSEFRKIREAAFKDLRTYGLPVDSTRKRAIRKGDTRFYRNGRSDEIIEEVASANIDTTSQLPLAINAAIQEVSHLTSLDINPEFGQAIHTDILYLSSVPKPWQEETLGQRIVGFGMQLFGTLCVDPTWQNFKDIGHKFKRIFSSPSAI